MTGWQLFAPLWFTEIVVLGYACTSSGCMEPAAHRVHLVQGPHLYCTPCTARWRQIYATFACHLVIERFDPGPIGDDTRTRFSLLELT